MCKNTNQKLVQNHKLVNSIHDKILIENKSDLSDAYTDACVWIAELQLQIDKMNKIVSSGYVRTDTSKIKWQPKNVVAPVDSADAWIRTGATDGGP
jgi:hypothetical protein